MAEEINLIVNVEGNGKKTVAEVREELSEAEKQAKKTGDTLGAGIDGAEKKTVSLKAQLRQMKQELLGMDEGSKEFQTMSIRAAELEDRIGDVNARIKALASDTKRIDALVGVGTGIAAGFQAASGAMALFGSDSKQVEKSIQNVIAIQGILNGVQTTAQLLQKEHIVGIYARMAAEKTAAVATIAWTVAQRVLNTVLKANPIGLLITGIAALAAGIGFLITNIDAVVDWFGKLFSAMLMIESEEDKIEANRARRAQENAKRNQERLNQINSEREERKKQFNEEQEALDLEIASLEAVGKSSYALRLQKAQNRLADLKAELEHIGKVSESWTKYYEDQAVLSGQSREDFIKTLKGQGIDIESLTTQREALQKEVETSIRQSEIEISKINYDESQERIKNAEKEKDEKLHLIDEYQRALGDQRRAEQEATAKFYEELNAKIEEQFNAEFDAMEAAIDRENQAKADAAAFEDELRNERLAKQQAYADETISMAQSTLKGLESLNQLFSSRETARINEKIKNGEQLTASEERQRKRQNAINKAFAVAQIAIDTATAVSGAIAQAQSVPYPANIAAIASGVAAVLAGIAAAAAALQTAPPITAGASTSGSLEETADEVGGTTPNVRDLTGSTLLNPEPIEVYVVEAEMTKKQNNVKAIINEATFG